MFYRLYDQAKSKIKEKKRERMFLLLNFNSETPMICLLENQNLEDGDSLFKNKASKTISDTKHLGL